MRLADFILRNVNAIITEWEAFATTLLPAAASMTPLALRDHVQQILEAVAKDLSTAQTREAQVAKSMGRAPLLVGAPETAAETHANLRARSGFDIMQLAAEYRALRASVLRLWMDAHEADHHQFVDMLRFNEAIDQALAESIGFFNAQVEQARDLLLGMIGHDLRSPLQAIQTTASYLAALNAGADVSLAASRLMNSGARMKALLDDLVDFNRSTLGLGINVVPADVNLATLFADELERLRAAHPGRRVELEVVGNTDGHWDGRRLQQLLDNLVVNAIKYGARDGAVRVVIIDEKADVRFEVRNAGRVIDRSTLEQMFHPLRRGPEHQNGDDGDGSLGLGLYIAREIARAHGGEIEARSENSETVFAVRLSRRQ